MPFYSTEGGNLAFAQTWEDFTSKIVNPSFENDAASSNLKDSGWGTGTGWTITPSSPANSQSGIASASTTIQGIGTNFSPANESGNNYMYIRCNWQPNTEFKVNQVLSSTTDLPKGTYRLTCKVANFSSNYYSTSYSLSLGDGSNTSKNSFFFSEKAWSSMSVVFYKNDDATDLTIEAYMKPGNQGTGQHYCLLIDDFKLEYLGDETLELASESNPIDLTAAISNPTIYNKNKTNCPKGWSCPAHTVGNSNYTEGPGDTQLEGWSNGTLNVHYTQTLTNLPNGKYVIKAKVHDSNDTGAYLYATSGSNNVTGDMGKDYAVVSTDVISITNQTIALGIKGENIGGTWMTGDDFQIFYVGVDLTSLKAQVEELRTEAETVLADEAYINVTGSERTELTNAKEATVEETKTALDAAILKIRTAIDTFKAAKVAYDSYATEKVTADKFGINLDDPTTAADAEAKTKDLNVEEYNSVSKDYTTSIELGTWTTEGAATFNNEHWSGNKVNYLNQNDANNQGWNSTAWTMSCEQTITLPAGEYVFKAAGRKSTNAHLDLYVKAGETELGVVSNFPNGNTGLGITTSGKASFDAGETYAHSNTGYGWQWRFVPFTLTEKTAVTFTISAGANAIHNWASFGDYTVMAKPNLAASKIAYNQAVKKAEAAKVDYPIAACAELTGLENAKTVTSETVEGYENATAAIESAIAALTDARTAYQSLAEAKSITQEELPYAAAEKYTALQNAIDVETTAEITKTIAETYASAITTALRAYYESNAKAEGVTGATDCTSLVVNANFSDGLNGWSSTQSGGNLGTLNNQTWTNSDGSTGGYYYDYYNSSANNQHGYQVVNNLTPGKYIVTLKARAQSGFYLNLLINDKKQVDINEIGNTGGIFNNGWNDYTTEFVVDKAGTVKIEVANQPSSNQSGWFGFGDVRLYRLGDLDEVALDENANNTITAGLAKVTLKRTIVESVWNTLVLPFEMSNEEVLSVFGEGAKVAAFSNADANDVYFKTTQEGIKANTPVLIQATAGTEFTFDGYTLVEGTAKAEGAMFDFVGSYAPTNLANGDYMLNDNKFWKNEGKGYNVKGFRAYLSPKTSTEVKSLNLIMDDVATGITIADLDADADGKTYNMAGQRVSSNYKGLVIKNGKKAVIK